MNVDYYKIIYMDESERHEIRAKKLPALASIIKDLKNNKLIDNSTVEIYTIIK